MQTLHQEVDSLVIPTLRYHHERDSKCKDDILHVSRPASCVHSYGYTFRIDPILQRRHRAAAGANDGDAMPSADEFAADALRLNLRATDNRRIALTNQEKRKGI